MRERPGHGISQSSRLQIHTVLSKIFNTSLLIFLEPNKRLYAHQGGAPTLLKLAAVSSEWDERAHDFSLLQRAAEGRKRKGKT